ncbi:hypothetical protein EGW08_016406, partial [Elysia chlorotica]
MSSDEELSEAYAASNSQIFRVIITEKATTMQTGDGQNAEASPRVLPTAPPQPCYEQEPTNSGIQGQHGSPPLVRYKRVKQLMHGDHFPIVYRQCRPTMTGPNQM